METTIRTASPDEVFDLSRFKYSPDYRSGDTLAAEKYLMGICRRIDFDLNDDCIRHRGWMKHLYQPVWAHGLSYEVKRDPVLDFVLLAHLRKLDPDKKIRCVDMGGKLQCFYDKPYSIHGCDARTIYGILTRTSDNIPIIDVYVIPSCSGSYAGYEILYSPGMSMFQRMEE